LDWLAEFLEVGLDPNGAGELGLIHHLLPLDMSELYKKIIISDVKKIHEYMHEEVFERAVFGFLPVMSGCCDGQIGAVNAESFAERIISGVNLAMADGNNLLNGKTLQMLVVLRMNRNFMVFMRENYLLEIKAL
jgi:hypothetical protein